MRQADAGPGVTGALTTDEREELGRLRRGNRMLQMERDIPLVAEQTFRQLDAPELAEVAEGVTYVNGVGAKPRPATTDREGRRPSLWKGRAR